MCRPECRALRQTGYDVECRIYDGEDHYLILSQPEGLLDDLARFMIGKPSRSVVISAAVSVPTPFAELANYRLECDRIKGCCPLRSCHWERRHVEQRTARAESA